MFDTYIENEIDLMNPKAVADEYVQVAEDSNDWYVMLFFPFIIWSRR